jgi:hypothetical protein
MSSASDIFRTSVNTRLNQIRRVLAYMSSKYMGAVLRMKNWSLLFALAAAFLAAAREGPRDTRLNILYIREIFHHCCWIDMIIIVIVMEVRSHIARKYL